MEEHRRPARLARVIIAVAVAAGFVVGPIHNASPQILGGGGGEVRGMGITRPGVDLNKTLGDLGQMRRAGVNSVMIDVWWDVDDEKATTMHPGSITTPDDTLIKAIQQSKAAGMRVYFMPKLWCPNCSHTWRGILQPTPRTSFYDNYRAFIDKYADLARTAGADLFVIGSEMNSTQNDDLNDGQGAGAPWRKVAEEAKQHFGGRITYDANWDTVNEVKFWDAVDLISVSAYYPLTDDDRPSVSQIKSAWQSSKDQTFSARTWANDLATLATTKNKQILFGEVGYLSSTRAGERPYDPSNQHEYSDAVQTNFYQALLETFQGQPWWAGVFWWEWYQDDSPNMSYTPRDKMTEQFLKAWYVDNWRGGEYSATVAATTTTTTPQGSTTTTTTQPGPYKHPPPNSAPVPNGPAPYTPPPPPSSASPPSTQPNQPYTPPQNSPQYPPPQYPPPQYAPPQYAPQPTSPPPTAPAYIPNSAPVISGERSTTSPTFARVTTTTVPPTTTTVVPHKEAVVVPSNAGLPPTPPLFSPRPVVARTYDGGVRPSRGRALMLGALSIFLPLIGALLAVVAIQQNEERMRRASFSTARVYAWQLVGEPQLARAPAVRRPPRQRSSRATWPARQPWPHRAAHRRPGGLRQWFRGR